MNIQKNPSVFWMWTLQVFFFRFWPTAIFFDFSTFGVRWIRWIFHWFLPTEIRQTIKKHRIREGVCTSSPGCPEGWAGAMALA
jgi:hypothetical protein